MLRRFLVFLLCIFFVLTSCEQTKSQGELKKVGLLVPETIDDHVWGTKGYKGILKIQSAYNVDVFYKEGMDSITVVEKAVKEFADKGVNLIFGHGHEYGEYFASFSNEYPDIHFITFNTDAKNSNITSLNFESYAMGFFAGMVAGEMTKTNRIGIIPAYEWQPEINGFLEGANYINSQIEVDVQYVGNFDDKKKALRILNKMLQDDIDVFYPAGDSYSVPIIEKVKEEGLYAIGYVSDQSDLGNYTVLTSTIQHVDVLYEMVAEKVNNGKMESGNLFFDFQEDAISLGEYSPQLEKSFVKRLEDSIKTYKETGKLPNE